MDTLREILEYNDDYSLKEAIYKKIEELEFRTYGHSDNAEEMTDRILYLIEASEVEKEELKIAIAEQAIFLLEEYRFE